MQERVLLGEGREAEVYLLPDGTVLKLMRLRDDATRVEREAAACAALADTGAPAPDVVDVVDVDGRPGLIIRRLPGSNLLSLLERNPLSVLRAARVLAEKHLAVHETTAPPVLPEVHAQLRERIERAEALSEEMREVALQVLNELPRSVHLCHGDYHLGNLLGSWRDAIVIDWGYASRGDPVGDVAQSVLLHRIGAMPPGTGPMFTQLARVGRRLLTGRYLQIYRRSRPFDRREFDRWYFVHAAARLGEPVADEHQALLALLQRQLPSLR